MATVKRTGEVLGFSVFQSYNVPLEKLWDAATQARHLNRFFTKGAKGNISPKVDFVIWRWPGADPVEVKIHACEPHQFFEFEWKAPHNDRTRVRMEFARVKGRTIIWIFEFGWKPNHVDQAFDHCGGWSEWLYGLKAYVQYGIDLRK